MLNWYIKITICRLDSFANFLGKMLLDSCLCKYVAVGGLASGADINCIQSCQNGQTLVYYITSQKMLTVQLENSKRNKFCFDRSKNLRIESRKDIWRRRSWGFEEQVSEKILTRKFSLLKSIRYHIYLAHCFYSCFLKISCICFTMCTRVFFYKNQ